jgi:hypothetical protein
MQVNNNIPSIHTYNGVYAITRVEFPGAVSGWRYGQSHMKFGVSGDANRPVVCFGDANHRRSELTHFGMTVIFSLTFDLLTILQICLEDIALHATMLSMIKALDVQENWLVESSPAVEPTITTELPLGSSAAPPTFKIKPEPPQGYTRLGPVPIKPKNKVAKQLALLRAPILRRKIDQKYDTAFDNAEKANQNERDSKLAKNSAKKKGTT